MERDFSFTLEKQDPHTRARLGRLRTRHSTEVQTPLFMPVATQATVKSVRQADLQQIGFPILLANTYHLMLRPGAEVFEKLGGIHGFMKWGGSVLTDSGGYQVFSLPHARKISEQGALFASYIDGKKVWLTPETSVSMQRSIGSDIMMAFDQCIPSTASIQEAREAMERTHRWAKRSLDARGDSWQAMFGIVQGACYEDLRRESADFITNCHSLAGGGFDGFAIGGLAVGETKSEREDFTEMSAALLPIDRPRYLMGVGTPLDLLEAVKRGVDLFDCILPTSMAQRGFAFTSIGKVRISRQVYHHDESALDVDCGCSTCTKYSKAYLHHLIKGKEPLGWTLLSLHNLHFYAKLMHEIRRAIRQGRYLEFYRDAKARLSSQDQEEAIGPKLGAYRLAKGPSQEFAKILHEPSGEIMHRSVNPNHEAKELYLEKSGLLNWIRKSATQTGFKGELVIWDVGLGAAHNAMAILHSLTEELADLSTLKLRIVSFENDLDSLRLAMSSPTEFPHLNLGWIEQLLQTRRVSGERFEWTLLEGDFLDCLETSPTPDWIIFDPFSTRTNPALWTLECFEKVRAKIGQTRSCMLATYSCATAVREALLCAGFLVCEGEAFGTRPSCTLAMTSDFLQHHPGLRSRLLSEPWLDRWKKSSARRPERAANLLAHPQFQGTQVKLR